MRSRVLPACIVMLAALGPAACSCAAAHELDGGSIDSSQLMDSLAIFDAVTPVDAHRVCPPVVEARPPCGTCDGMGRTACISWGVFQACGQRACPDAGAWIGFAECSSWNPPECCAKVSGGSIDDAGVVTAFCGDEPPCGPNEVCASRFDGDPPACRCIADAP